MTYNILAEGLVGSCSTESQAYLVSLRPTATPFCMAVVLSICISHSCVSAAQKITIASSLTGPVFDALHDVYHKLTFMLLFVAGNCTWGAAVSAGSHLVFEMELSVARLAG